MTFLPYGPGGLRMQREAHVHVYPRADLREHAVDADGRDCWCGAEPDEDLIVVHNSADGREDYEYGRRKRH